MQKSVGFDFRRGPEVMVAISSLGLFSIHPATKKIVVIAIQ